MAVKTNITINIVEPGSDVPVPDTGLFTHGIGGTETTAIGAVLILTIAAIIVTILYRKQKKAGKVTKLVHIIDSTKAVLKSKKRITAGLTALALLASAGTLTALLTNAGKSNTNAAEGDNDLTLDVSSKDLTIEVKDQPVFAVLPVQVTVEEATQAGYTLTAYTESTDLVSTTNPNNKIPMVALPETAGELSPLTDNTYGLALGEEPTTKDAEVYMPLSIDSDIPTIIKSMPEYTPTAENDTTTIYYGFYITPDIPYGTYTNDSEVYYNATINTTPVTFDGNGLYFNEDKQQTTNEVEYIAVPEEGKEYNINQIISGEYKTPSQDLPYNFLGWSTDPEATVPTYETEEKIAEFLPILPNTPITLYAVWQKATTITFNGNGADSGAMDTQTIIAGESDSLYENTFVKDGYHFTGWNTVVEPTEQEPGKAYADQADYTAPATSQYLTLYAQWEEDILYMQDVATWGETLSLEEQVIAVDNRDGKEYTVAKLRDGKIWMTRNLDLQKENLLPGVAIDNTNTDHPVSGFVLPDSQKSGNGSWGRDGAATNTAHVYDLNGNGEAYHYCEEYGQYASCKAYSEEPIPPEDLGNYYNWYSATAGTGTYSTVNQATGSICPAGWRLPTSSVGESSDYGTLLQAYNITVYISNENLFNPPLSFARAGYYSDGATDVGIRGSLWSSKGSTINGAAYYFGFTDSAYLFNQEKNIGSLVRCLAE